MSVWRFTGEETTILFHVIARLTHYVHKIASENEDTLEFVSNAGDRIIVALTDEERRQI